MLNFIVTSMVVAVLFAIVWFLYQLGVGVIVVVSAISHRIRHGPVPPECEKKDVKGGD